MISNLVFYQLGLIALVSLFLILYGLWPSEPAAARPMTPKPLLPRCKHSQKPKPFPGLTRQPCCAACEQAIEAPRLQPSPPPPPTMPSTRGRRRHVLSWEAQYTINRDNLSCARALQSCTSPA